MYICSLLSVGLVSEEDYWLIFHNVGLVFQGRSTRFERYLKRPKVNLTSSIFGSCPCWVWSSSGQQSVHWAGIVGNTWDACAMCCLPKSIWFRKITLQPTYYIGSDMRLGPIPGCTVLPRHARALSFIKLKVQQAQGRKGARVSRIISDSGTSETSCTFNASCIMQVKAIGITVVNLADLEGVKGVWLTLLPHWILEYSSSCWQFAHFNKSLYTFSTFLAKCFS